MSLVMFIIDEIQSRPIFSFGVCLNAYVCE